MSLTSWFLVSSGGTRHRLPREMIFVGRDDCELMLQSRSVDKQHAVINYDASMDEHLVKDLGSLNGTFVNDVRIPEQTYITLKLEDKLRFGYDTNLFTVVRGEMRVPEEALKHEKFTIQLQLSQKSSESELSKSACAKSIDSKVADTSTEVQHKATEVLKSEEKAMDISAMPRGTPLYGQPSWWGDDEVEDQRAFKSNGKAEEKSHETGTAGCSIDAKQVEEQSAAAANEEVLFPFCREPSYFEIPTKEFQQPSQITESTIHEIPTKDTPSSHTAGAGHASFTIEFDDSTPGKVTIRDHVTKFTSDQRHKSKKSSPGTQDLPGIQTGMMAPENKVADWLAQNNPPQMVWERTEEDSKSIKSDVPVYLKRLKGNKHDDGTQSDSENAGAHRRCSKRAALEEHLRRHHSEQKKLQKAQSAEKHQDQAVVFGVDDNQDYNRPIINEKHKDLIKDWALSSAAIVMEERKPLSTPGFHNSEEGTSSSGNKRWVSQWASLAANHTRHDQEERIMELSVPVPLENDTDISESGISLRSTGSATSLASQGERRRRTLPQLPNEEKSLESSRAKVITQRSEIGEKQDTELQEKEAPTQAYQKDKQDADRPLSKMSRAVNGEAVRPGGDNKTLLHLGSSSGKDKSDTDKEASVVKQTLAKIQQEQKEQAQWTPSKLSASKNVSGQIDRCREESFKQESQPQEKVPGHSTSKGERVTQNESKRRKAEDVLKGQSSKGGDKKESSKSLVRQGSFTIEKPSPNIPIELIPHINKQTSSTPPSLALTAASRIRERSDSMDTDSSMDTTLILKDTEAVMAFLEAKLREDNKTDEGPDTPSYNRDNSISPESDVDTASTISLVTGETERKSTQKRKSFTSLYKDRCSTGSPSKDVTKSSSSGAREKIEKKTKSRSSDVGSRADGRKFVQSSGRMRQPSVDLTDDDQTSSVPHSAISDIMSSDQETYSCKSHARTPLTSTDEHAHSKLEGSKVTKSKTSPVAPGSSSKSTTLPRPRPTRTSLLRRARLGEVSDSELADADKASVASEVSTTSSTSKPPTGRRNISRIDLLAQPRRTRLGSLSARSDSEATISRSSASSRTAEAIIRSGARLVPSDKFSPRIRANSISRLSDSKVKSMTSAHGSPSALKTTRLQSSGSAAMPTSSSFKHRIKEQEDYIRDWTAHREEIARISQDLALIAREINDVAGEIDSVTSSGTAPSTTVSTAATTPGSAIDTREEVGDLHGEMHKLVDRVFDESLNFRKIPPLVHSKTPEGNNCRSGDPRPQPTEPPDHLTITRRRTWSRDEVMGDNLLLSSVFQFSRKIRQSIDKTAGKIRILFKDKDRNWDEIESKLRAESEVPIVKTSSMEISSILQELKRVEKQLQAINAMIDPDGTLEALNNMGFPSAILPSPPKQKSPVNNHSSPGQTPTLCPPEARVPHPAAISVSAEFENAESEADFSIHFNRFNPDGEEEDVTVHE
ncbi:centrosomal protein of 170 kDa isoform X11 [Canis lupus baileyi]|uniref:Centrosomal protein of 170 kDa n=1 Tax=Canis lupus familiaris TaxID=9615 RepID=A0A8P0PPD3_CANLF|nr:centrosomal protein of 170 kDa isoform X10 [Canis lupus familiaris]XP_048968342.1 centrosomal protein of 170 kDa isoform X10 [Canis lupus dingo]XP_863169.1 centrosomal protein of 170 kDa isoform X10 [Canis lupus familiaris]|eukprot:XP_863169.1 centrosomal protein of 170 kDa isoform X10 [Canis lupus familiaris]